MWNGQCNGVPFLVVDIYRRRIHTGLQTVLLAASAAAHGHAYTPYLQLLLLLVPFAVFVRQLVNLGHALRYPLRRQVSPSARHSVTSRRSGEVRTSSSSAFSAFSFDLVFSSAGAGVEGTGTGVAAGAEDSSLALRDCCYDSEGGR